MQLQKQLDWNGLIGCLRDSLWEVSIMIMNMMHPLFSINDSFVEYSPKSI